MTRIVYRRTLLWSLVRGAEEDPLLRGRHLRARLWVALRLKHDGQTVELHAELTKMFVLPDTFVLALWGRKDLTDAVEVAPNRL